MRKPLLFGALAVLLGLILLSNAQPRRLLVLAPTPQNLDVDRSLSPPPGQLLQPPSPPPSSVILSPWDAELNERHRAMLRLPSVPPARIRSLPSVNASSGCADQCSNHGQCYPVRIGSSGAWALRCACRPGWEGERCERRDASPCNTPEGGRVLTRCAGSCHDDVNRCMCGEGSRFPSRPMMQCIYEGVEKDMPWQTPLWGNFRRAPKGEFWTPGGPAAASTQRGATVAWCDADPALGQRPRLRCKCYDGQVEGRLCAPVSARSVDATFCPNQCHLRGECISGFCRCPPGYAGADCSIDQTAGTLSRADAIQTTSALDRLLDTIDRAKTSPSEEAAPRAIPSTDAVARPRIYVYEIPGDYNVFLLARRQSNDACAIREYTDDSATAQWTPTLYGAEVALHEALLASPHRTLDPDEADFFYVPVYGGCFISEFNRPAPRHWLCDQCHKGQHADLASLRAMRWHESLLAHVRTAYPYWNRSNGADHLWPFTHDEGACYAPSSIGNATLLVHWGRMHTRPNGSSEYHLWRVKPHARRMYGWRRCYDPCKDLVLPSWRKPEAILGSAYYEAATKGFDEGVAPPRSSQFLFYFNGVLGTKTMGGGRLDNYSFGLRQQLYSLFGEREAEGIVVTDKKTPMYAAHLSSSTFCGVLPGWGWSGRFEDAVLHGCIPVILQDGVHTPWESVLDAPSYALRVPRNQMHRLLDVLKAMTPAQITARQAALRRAWPRFSYLSVAAAESRRRGHRVPPELAAVAQRDAVATLLQVLRARAQLRAARNAPGGVANPAVRPVGSCEAQPHGGDISPAASVGAELRFEDRTVNGWII